MGRLMKSLSPLCEGIPSELNAHPVSVVSVTGAELEFQTEPVGRDLGEALPSESADVLNIG